MSSSGNNIKRALIVIPTYNEADNICRLIKEISALNVKDVNLDILVIDDNSLDGTSSLVKNLKLDNVFIIDRPKKSGLGTAYIAGFKYANDKDYDYVSQEKVTMDIMNATDAQAEAIKQKFHIEENDIMESIPQADVRWIKDALLKFKESYLRNGYGTEADSTP